VLLYCIVLYYILLYCVVLSCIVAHCHRVLTDLLMTIIIIIIIIRNEKRREKFGSCTRKTFDRFTTKDSYTWNITHNTESTAA